MLHEGVRPWGSRFSRMSKVPWGFDFQGKGSNNMRVFNWLTATLPPTSSSLGEQGSSPQKGVHLFNSLCKSHPGHMLSGSKATPTLPICSTALPTGTFGPSRLVDHQLSIHRLPVWLKNHPITYNRSKNAFSGRLHWVFLCSIKEGWCGFVFSRPGYY